eukprot:gene10239-671_t
MADVLIDRAWGRLLHAYGGDAEVATATTRALGRRGFDPWYDFFGSYNDHRVQELMLSEDLLDHGFVSVWAQHI